MMGRISLMLLLVTAAPLSAQDRDAPDYYLDEIVAVTTAQQLAEFCADVEFVVARAVESSGDLVARLAADGYDTQSPTLGMMAAPDRILERQQAFMDKHDMTTDNPACKAAETEMAENSAIGRYLTEVQQ